ncbi:MAG TPA: antibiotic biosynthesis monooxygenase [Myxococcaceae bacterium]|jgi:heme-degrading monooxygenase HmoA
MKRNLLSLLLVLGLSACGEEPVAPPPTPADPLANCTRGSIEPDLTFLAPLGGPALRADGTLTPGRYIVSSTYLAMKPEPQAQQHFGELMGPIRQTLQQQQGLLAIQLGTSESCATARTLTVWKDEESMYSFVTSDAHLAAMSAVGEVSRGSSVVTHWADDENGVSWTKAAQQLGADEGPLY